MQAAGLFHFIKIYDKIKKGIDSRVDSFQTTVSMDVVAAVVWPDFSIYRAKKPCRGCDQKPARPALRLRRDANTELGLPTDPHNGLRYMQYRFHEI